MDTGVTIKGHGNFLRIDNTARGDGFWSRITSLLLKGLNTNEYKLKLSF